MADYLPKVYQQNVLESVERYFHACHEMGDADTAFYKITRELWGDGIKYHPIAGFPARMPYFCLRIPTGGGKTWLAAKSVALVNRTLLRSEHSVILWLVPSRAIRDQTLGALKDREHPYYAAIGAAGAVTVLDLDGAKSVTRATLDTSTTIIVCTRQAFQVDDQEIRKVYESSGALMSHFEGLDEVQRKQLLSDENGVIPNSLANVLRLRRPFVIVDEAHNSRTALSFETLSRFLPSGILELTATPDVERNPSNVLHSVSAAELKTEEMIKLPILLETEPDWQKCLAGAIDTRERLQVLAEQEHHAGAAYLRPVVLIQAAKRRGDIDTLDVDRVRQELIDNHNIPAEQIARATGEYDELERLATAYVGGIASERCPVRFVITQQALAEGWDCPSAYILVSMAELHAATSVEQLLGRVLRQPQARRRESVPLNQSYAFVVSKSFGDTARALRDRLVEGAGFERRDASAFIAPARPDQAPLDLEARAVPIDIIVRLAEKPDLDKVPGPLLKKIGWDDAAGKLTITQSLDDQETEALKRSVETALAQEAIGEAVKEMNRKALEYFKTPAEQGAAFRVPQLAVRVQGHLQLFDDAEILDYPWDLATYPATPTQEELDRLQISKAHDGGKIDIDAAGHVVTEFMADLQRDLGLSYRPEHWDEVKLATWFCQNLSDNYTTHSSKRAFVAKWLQGLLLKPGCDLAEANRQKFIIRNLLERHMHELRMGALRSAYKRSLFDDGNETRVVVGNEYGFDFNPYAYAPNRDYDGRFGRFGFRKHYYGRVGDFDSQEEFECACWLDQQAQKGRIEFWVRNLVRKLGCSFFLQKADGKFYPDFVCKLPDGIFLVVEYKGADRWAAAEDDRLIGGLWAGMSGGKCRFVMLNDKRWEKIPI